MGGPFAFPLSGLINFFSGVRVRYLTDEISQADEIGAGQ